MLIKCPSSIKPPLHWKLLVARACTQALFFLQKVPSEMFDGVLTVFWRRFCLDNCSVTCAVTLSCVLHQTNFWHIQNSIYSGIFRVTHIVALLSIFRLLQTYSASFQTLTYSQTGQISSPSIFRTGGIFKNLWNFDQAYLERSERTVYSGIIQPYSGIFRTLCNAYICRNLTYSESWNIQNASIIESRRIFPTLSYLRK